MDHVQLKEVLTKVFTSNQTVPLAIWGQMGMGRTAIPEMVANELGYNFCKFSMGLIDSPATMIKKYNERQIQPNTHTIIVVDELTRANTPQLMNAMELLLNQSIDGQKLNNIHVLTSNPVTHGSYKTDEERMFRQNQNFMHIEISNMKNQIPMSTIQDTDLIGFPTMTKDSVCECGAKHSSNPNYHQNYCPLNTKG